MPPKSKRASSRGRGSSRGQRTASSPSHEVVTITAEVHPPPVESEADTQPAASQPQKQPKNKSATITPSRSQSPSPASPVSPGCSSSSSSRSLSAASSQDRGKRKKSDRINCSLSEAEEAIMVEWLQENRTLWDSKLQDYHKITNKEKLWEAHAEKMHKTVKHLKGWFRSLRDKNTRLMKHKSGDGAPRRTERDEWVLSNFRFLQEVVRHRPEPAKPILPSRVLAAATVQEEDLPVSGSSITESSAIPYRPATAASGSSSFKRPRRCGQDEDTTTKDEVLGTLQEKVKESEAILKGLLQPPAVTPESTFANYVRDSLLTMSSLKFKKARASINKILTRLMDEDTEEEEEDLPTFSARCRSTPYPGITTTRQAQSDMFQPDPSTWRDNPPSGTPWQSQNREWMARYYQQQPQTSFQQPHSSYQPPRFFQQQSRNSPVVHTLTAPATTHASVSAAISSARHAMDQSNKGSSSPAPVVTCAAMDATVFPTGVSTAASVSDLFSTLDSPVPVATPSMATSLNDTLNTPQPPVDPDTDSTFC